MINNEVFKRTKLATSVFDIQNSLFDITSSFKLKRAAPFWKPLFLVYIDSVF